MKRGGHSTGAPLSRKELNQHYIELFNKLAEPKRLRNHSKVKDEDESIQEETKEESKKKISLHPSIHNFHTIKWLRRKLGQDTIIRSIYTLIPNGGAPMNVDENAVKSKAEILREFLDNYLKSNKKTKAFTLDPHYMFSNETLNKIYKLRHIFLEFDEDQSRKLEMGELEQMFRTNKIITKLEDLCRLFFPENNGSKKVKEELNFYEFLEFALSANSDQSFRNFMRELKENNQKLRGSLINVGRGPNGQRGRHFRHVFSKSRESDFRIKRSFSADENKSAHSKESNTSDDSDKEDMRFLPMNFNLVLDYFNKKGKVREWEKQISKAIVSFI